MLHKGILVHCNDDVVGFTVITVTVPVISQVSGKLSRTPSSAGLRQVWSFNVQWKTSLLRVCDLYEESCSLIKQESNSEWAGNMQYLSL